MEVDRKIKGKKHTKALNKTVLLILGTENQNFSRGKHINKGKGQHWKKILLKTVEYINNWNAEAIVFNVFFFF